MPTFNSGNVVGLIKGETPPDKTYVIWAKILNPSFPDLVELNYYDALAAAWTPLTDPTTNYWLRPVIDNETTTPPVTPTEGDRYLIPSGATGVWAGKTDQVTTFRSGAWVYQIPLDGFILSVRTKQNELFDYRGTYGAGGEWAENDFQVPIAPGTYLLATEKGQPLGVCELDSSGKIASARIDGSSLPYSPAIPGNWPGGMATVPAALDHLILNIGAGSGGSGIDLSKNVAKAAHGFVLGNVLTLDGTGQYIKINNPDDQRPVGIVTTVTDANNFKLTMSGFVSSLSGLSAGFIYYVQATGLLSTSVTSLPYLLALSATEGYIMNGAGAPPLGSVLANDNDASAQRIVNLADPVDPQDAATRAYLISYVATALANLVDSSPATLDTLNELAAALGDDPNFATTVSNQLGLKAPLASPALSGTPTAPTAVPGTNTTQIATTAFVAALGALKADLASPILTGTPVAPTPALGTNTTQLATTAFIQDEIGKFVDLGDVTGVVSVDLSTGRIFKMTAINNITLTFTNAVIGKTYMFIIITNTTGRTITWTTAKFRFAYGISPTLTNPIPAGQTSAEDIFTGFCRSSGVLDIVVTPNMILNS